MKVDDLVARALEAQKRAYAPYSRYPVGCALSAGGAVHEGANVENSSYGLALCAERSAVARAVFAGARVLDAVVVATDSSPPAAPCGMCLQTLSEFAGDPAAMRIILVNPAGERRELSLVDLLPHGFRREQLTTRPGGPGSTSGTSGAGG
ncbi:MAG TPA: cytidine deaminase [Kofleriaceae bacterium]|nr:cytidine deaminase [Kofleriaceae bacterium]